MRKQIHLLATFSLFCLLCIHAGESEALSLINTRNPSISELRTEIKAYEEVEASLSPREKLIYATLLMLNSGSDFQKVRKLTDEVIKMSPDSWLSDYANLMRISALSSIDARKKVTELEHAIRDISFTRLLQSSDPLVSTYKTRGLSEETGTDSLFLQLAYAYRDTAEFDKAREVSAGIKSQNMREHCLKQIDYFERKKDPQNATKKTPANDDMPKTESFSSGSQPPNEKAELIQAADEKPAEVAAVEHIEERVEKSSSWWLWLIGALIVVGSVLVLRRKS